MIDFISTWVQGIIVSVTIATIIEMILPNGNSKKYIKMVIGIFIVFNIISPIVSKFTGKQLSLTDIVNIEKFTQDTSAYKTDTQNIDKTNNSNIKEVYILNIKKDMKTKIETLGYVVNTIQIDLEDDENYTINRINLVVRKKENKNEERTKNSKNEIKTDIKEIEKVNININVNDNRQTIEGEDNNKDEKNYLLNTSEINEIKEYIYSNYEINKDNIYINK